MFWEGNLGENKVDRGREIIRGILGAPPQKKIGQGGGKGKKKSSEEKNASQQESNHRPGDY